MPFLNDDDDIETVTREGKLMADKYLLESKLNKALAKLQIAKDCLHEILETLCMRKHADMASEALKKIEEMT